ncbi:MAG: NAD(P)/FAD-dependent oxidoreductase [Sphingomonas sp.]
MDVAAGRSELRDWLTRFDRALADPARADWGSVFAPECYWRDFLAFTWNIVTLEGAPAIAAMAAAQAGAIAATALTPDDPSLPMTDATQGWFTFETATARCRGHVQLQDGRAHVLLTAATELLGHEEPGGARRPAGIEHHASRGRRTWLDERQEEARTLGHDVQPWCLVVGGGQNGLALAARLKRLSVPTLVIDAHERPGDVWRKRYKSLYLHDPIYLDHFPYLPFPDHWPLYTSKDKMGDWIEAYARVMELNLWNETRCTGARYDADAGEWEVTVERQGETLTLRPKHLVLATGLSGTRHIPSIPGADGFKGQQYHSADHAGGKAMEGRNCVVIGASNSAHDICVDLWENDARVTMLQRSPTIVVRADTMRQFSDALPYAQGVDIDTADLMMAATPFRLRYEGEKGMTRALHEIDADFYARLAASGFQLTDGVDGTGFLMAYHRTASGYYIDVGASDLIAAGEIAVRQGEIEKIEEHGIRLADGGFLPADLIVYATGYRPMGEWLAELISPEVEARVGPCWGLGSDTEGDPGPWEGELRNMWKPTAQEALWIQGGNLMQARFHSLHLALQLKARMEGLPTPVFVPEGQHAEPEMTAS